MGPCVVTALVVLVMGIAVAPIVWVMAQPVPDEADEL